MFRDTLRRPRLPWRHRPPTSKIGSGRSPGPVTPPSAALTASYGGRRRIDYFANLLKAIRTEIPRACNPGRLVTGVHCAGRMTTLGVVQVTFLVGVRDEGLRAFEQPPACLPVPRGARAPGVPGLRGDHRAVPPLRRLAG